MHSGERNSIPGHFIPSLCVNTEDIHSHCLLSLSQVNSSPNTYSYSLPGCFSLAFTPLFTPPPGLFILPLSLLSAILYYFTLLSQGGNTIKLKTKEYKCNKLNHGTSKTNTNSCLSIDPIIREQQVPSPVMEALQLGAWGLRNRSVSFPLLQLMLTASYKGVGALHALLLLGGNGHE